MKRRLLRLVIIGAAYAAIEAAASRAMRRRTRRDPWPKWVSRWRLGWHGCTGDFYWAFSPSDLNRLEVNIGDPGSRYVTVSYGTDGCDPVLSLGWEPTNKNGDE